MNTDQLIERLCQNSPGCARLCCPWRRTAQWLAVALPYVGFAVLVLAPRADLATKVVEWRFLVELAAALSTGVIAAVAAFATTIPGLNRRLLLLPLAPLALLFGSVGYGCLSAWVTQDAAALALRADWRCASTIVLIGAGPAVSMGLMLRQGAPLTPRLTMALAGLAAGALAIFGLRLIHPQDTGMMVVVWQIGAVMLLTALAAAAGRYVLSWRSTVGLADR